VNSSERGQAGDPDLADPGSPEEPSRSLISRWLSKADRYASHPLTAVLVIGAAVIWIAISVAAGFPSQWEIVFQSVVAAVTLAVVFIIQHTQARYQRATQRKLDEILLTMSGTDNSLLALEHAPDEELRATGHRHRQIRSLAGGDRGPGIPASGCCSSSGGAQ
jgi:low affinity Fe/Cu permease